jgi:hypothetical protein
MVPRITAAQFHRFMTSGRTSPILCGCQDDQGNRVDDYVVKLRGGLDRGEAGLVCELVASRLASHFGISVPEQALVLMDVDFAELVAAAEPQHADRLRNSIGLNFGSRQLSDVSGWPVDKWIPEAMWQAAVDIFAFDALIQNPDRRYSNQNLLTRGDDIFVYDHELAFSFVEAILPSRSPWRLEGQPYLTEHVFYRQLKKKPIDLDGFTSALAALPGAALDAVLAEVPSEWNNERLSEIELHLRTVAGRAEEFAEEVKRRLA